VSTTLTGIFVFGVPEDDISDGRIIELVRQLQNDKEITVASKKIGQLIDKDCGALP
jgi:hypothetical protein